MPEAYSNQAQLHMLANDLAPAIEWGTRATALADQLGLLEARLHATINVAAARVGLADERGWAELEDCLHEARFHGMEDHAGRAYACLVSCAVTACRLSVAERYFLEGTAFCIEHDLDSYRRYLLGWRAVLLLRRGRWAEASAGASMVLSHPHVSAISRIQALVALGSVHARRGEAGAATEALDEALQLALETTELQRLGPVRAARAEAAWLAGNLEAARLEAQAGFDLAVKHDYHAITGELAHWLWRSGGLVSRPAAWRSDVACTLWAEGEVRQAAVFGEHLRLRRRVEADLGGNTIRLTDTVTNAGFDPTPHMLLYHINLGWPLVDEGTRLVAPIVRTPWFTESVTAQRESYQRIPPPRPGFVEQVYAHEMAAGDDGRAAVALINDRLGFGFQLEWSVREFPYFFEWMHLREGAYAVGLEPSTHNVGGDVVARADGTMIWLQHGEARNYHTTFSILDGAEEIASAVNAIQAGQRQPTADVPG